MESKGWITITLSVILCQATSGLKKTELKRVKRWEGTGDMSNMFRGTAGVDYPDYKTIPTTNFRCSEQEYEGGLYADVETQCQVYHVCHDGRKDSFLCGKGTIFNQQILGCDYWYSTECDTAPSFYHLNSQIGNPVSSWASQGDPQHNAPRNNQGSNYGQSYPPTENQGINQNNPQSGNEEIPYDPNNPQINHQGNNYGQSYPQTENIGINHDPNNPHSSNAGTPYNQNNPQSSNPGIPYDQNNPQSSYQGSNDPETGDHGTNDQYNIGQNSQDYNLNNENRRNDENSGTGQDDKSCCCLKNTYKAPWNFPAFPGSQRKK